ncbi:MAG: arginine N-succinyltransferase [Deltaproteobacteria bacterium]|nr:arginine N-succinyltransferase [Deltaproteobacteria bacterium]
MIRAVVPSDVDSLYAVSKHLDSVNLPHDKDRLHQIAERSMRSFAGKVEAAKREFMFVLHAEDEPMNVLGCAMIFAQHGSRRAPHIFFEVGKEERYSETLDRLFVHTILRIGYDYQGVTEIGGLVLQPQARGHAAKLGKQLSFVRFLFMAMRRSDFKDEIVSELMPPLEPDGRSLLWESLGRRFTGLSYQEADQLSRENKEFIRTLFPQGPIYASLLPPEAQAMIGQVGPKTKGVEHMLRGIGFEYASRIDPFDGGPHFHAKTDEVTLVTQARRLMVHDVAPLPARVTPVAGLVAVAVDEPPYFVARMAKVAIVSGHLVVTPELAQSLNLSPGSEVGFLPSE